MLGVRRWRDLVIDREKWRGIFRQAKAHEGCSANGRRRILQQFCILYLNAISLRRQHFIPEAALRVWWGVCLLPVLGSCYNLACNCCFPSCRSSQHALSPACTWTTVCKCPLTGTYINQHTDDEYVILEWPLTLSRRECYETLAARRGTQPQNQRSIHL